MEIEVKNPKIEIIEKKGKVMTSEELRIKDEESQKSEYKDFKDFGQVDFADHEIEETIKRDNKINDEFAQLSVFICVVILVYFRVFNPQEDIFTPCLEKLAKEYCDNNNFIFINNSVVNRDINSFFSCYIDDRTRETKRFYFLNKEIEGCRNGKS